jgi:G3E family GTPase
MNTTIVCGLLGAGKTTFIQEVAKNTREKTVVLVNDFGKVGIDGEIFSAGGIESIELPSGCVCCTLKFDLITTLQKIRETLAPEHLFIEPSGVASPSAVLEALDLVKISPVTVVGIIDATEFLEFHQSQMFGNFFQDQIVNSDIILVNKTDLVDEGTTTRIIRILEDLNPGGIIVPTVKASLDGPLPQVSRSDSSFRKFETHIHHDTFSITMEKNEPLSFYKKLFSDLVGGMYGNVVRAKALVQTDEGPFRLDIASGMFDCVPFESTVTHSRIVIIGEDLKRDAFLISLREQD